MKLPLKGFAILLSGVFILVVAALSISRQQARNTGTAGNIVATGDMTVRRFDHTATLLTNGKVLIAGGMERNGVFLATSELYDPTTGRFAPGGKMGTVRGFGATATLLREGKVLIAGGWDGSACNRGAELYDFTTGAFTPTGSMTTPRCGAFAFLLQSGKVLILGGDEDSASHPIVSAELYDPSGHVFSNAGNVHGKASMVVLLKSGKLLVVGDSSAVLYDPLTQRFTPTGRLNPVRNKIGAALLPDGRVLVVGGQIGGAWGPKVAATEVYDPTNGRFTPGPNMRWERYKLRKGVVTLPSGRILVAGGADQPEVFDPTAGAFLATSGTKLDGFYFSSAILLANGDALLTGGYSRGGGAAVDHAWLYKP